MTLPVDGQIPLREPEHRQGQRALLLVEYAQHHPLPVIQRRRGHTQVDIDAFLRKLLEHDASVLRQPAFRDVEVAHDLEACNERARDLFGQAELLLAHPVNAIPHDQLLLPWLDVDVARPRKIGVFDYPVRQVDDRARLFAGHVLIREVLDGAEFGAELLDNIGELHLDLLVLAEFLADFPLASEQTDDLFAGHLMDLRRDRPFERIRDRHEQVFAHLTHRDHEVLLAEILRNALERLRPNQEPLHIIGGHAVGPRPGDEQLEVSDPVFVLQEFVERIAGQIARRSENGLLLLGGEAVHLLQLGDNLLLYLAECHGGSRAFRDRRRCLRLGSPGFDFFQEIRNNF